MNLPGAVQGLSSPSDKPPVPSRPWRRALLQSLLLLAVIAARELARLPPAALATLTLLALWLPLVPASKAATVIPAQRHPLQALRQPSETAAVADLYMGHRRADARPLGANHGTRPPLGRLAPGVQAPGRKRVSGVNWPGGWPAGWHRGAGGY